MKGGLVAKKARKKSKKPKKHKDSKVRKQTHIGRKESKKLKSKPGVVKKGKKSQIILSFRK